MSAPVPVQGVPDGMNLTNEPVALEIKAPQIDLLPKGLSSANYKFLQQTQVGSNGASVPIGAGIVQSIFPISGALAWNPFRSYITGDLHVAATTNNDEVNCVFVNNCPLDSIYLKTDSGKVLVEVLEAQVYSKVMQMLCLDMDTYKSRSSVYGDTGFGTAYPIGPCLGLQPANVPNVVPATAALANVAGADVATLLASVNANIVTPTNVLLAQLYGRASGALEAKLPSDAYMVDIVSGGTTNNGDQKDILPSATPANQNSGTDRLGLSPIQHLVCGAFTAGAPGGALVVRFRWNLGIFIGTLLGMDKTLYFGQNLQLILNWKSSAYWGFVGGPLSTATVVARALTLAATPLDNYYLYIANDVNPDNINELKAQVESQKGLELLIPYTESSQITAGQATGIVSFPKTLTANSGISLKRIITVPSNNVGFLKLTANNFNVGNVKFSSIQSYLDSRAIQQNPMLVANSDHWNQAYDLIKDSPLGMSQRTYDENFCWVENWSDCDKSTMFKDNDCLESGLDIGMIPRQYEVRLNKTSTAAIKGYQYATWCRKIILYGPMQGYRVDGV